MVGPVENAHFESIDGGAVCPLFDYFSTLEVADMAVIFMERNH